MQSRPGLLRSALIAATASAALLLIPLLAMRFTSEVNWTGFDFIVAGALLFGAGLAFLRLVRKSCKRTYRLAAAIAVGAVLLLVWVNLAVGVLGSENNPANLMYFALPLIGIVGAISTRGQSRGMARTLLVMAATQALIACIALIFRLGAPESDALEVLLLNGIFVALFGGSAWLFRLANGAGSQRSPAI